MSLDVDLMVVQPVSIFSRNITHNLGNMASQVKYGANALKVNDEGEELTLYHVLWRPEEFGFKYAKDISDLLDIGWKFLIADPQAFMKFNPTNGWGSYQGLVGFVFDYRNACQQNPDAVLRVSR